MNTPLFAVAAQVLIPALFLAVVLAAHAGRGRAGYELVIVAAATFALIIGEAAALHALGTEKPSAGLRRVTEIAMAIGAVAVFLLLAAPRLRALPWMQGQTGLAAVLACTYVAALFVGVLVVAQ